MTAIDIRNADGSRKYPEGGFFFVGIGGALVPLPKEPLPYRDFAPPIDPLLEAAAAEGFPPQGGDDYPNEEDFRPSHFEEEL